MARSSWSWLAVVVLGVLLLAWPSPARACSCMTVDTQTALDKADAVFEGTVVATYEGRRLRMPVVRVESVHKGGPELAGLVAVALAGKGTICEMWMPEGERWLVYATRDREQLRTGMCTRSRRVGDAEEDREVLGAGQRVTPLVLEAPEPDHWLSATLDAKPLATGSGLRRLDVTLTPPGAPGPRTPVALALVLDVAATGAARKQIVSAALSAMATLPDGSALAVVAAHKTRDPLVPLTTLNSTTRAEIQTLLESLSPSTAPPDLLVSLTVARAELAGASLAHAARFAVVIAGDRLPTGAAMLSGISSRASSIQGAFGSVSTFGVDVGNHLPALEAAAEAGAGQFFATTSKAELVAKVSAHVATLVDTRVALASIEVIAEPGVRVLGGLHADASRPIEAVTLRLGGLSAATPRTAAVYVDVPDGLTPDQTAVRVRLRYWDPRGTIGQAVETVAVKVGTP